MRDLTPAELSAFFDIGYLLLPGLFDGEHGFRLEAAAGGCRRWDGSALPSPSAAWSWW